MTCAVPAAAAAGFVLALVSVSGLSAQSDRPDVAAKPERTPFPAEMIAVPAGKVTVGTDADRLLDYTKQRYQKSPGPRVKLLHKLMAELGKTTVDVPAFYLNKYPVTNEQYLLFIQNSPKKQRFPFHWWKLGKPKEYAAKLDAWREAFPNEDKPDLLYWEKFWPELPYAIPPGEEKHPVVLVSWIDAQACAGWAGMRLPTEAEWLFAATGGAEKSYLWGEEWTDDKLKELQLHNARDKRIKEVGKLGAIARGPFGHEDMTANIWEWMGDVGFFPLAEATFQKELDRIKKQPATSAIGDPEWRGDRRPLKGGSFFSVGFPEEFRLQTRNPLERTQVVEGVGFRLAKSMIPARDMCRSRLVVEYDASFFGSDRAPNLDDQIGVERYDLTPDGRLITNYHAIAAVPVSHMGVERGIAVDRMRKDAQETPLIIGTLVTTETVETPALPPGMYTVYYRNKGMPKDLAEAIKTGSRVLASERRGGKGDAEKPAKPEKGEAEVAGAGEAGQKAQEPQDKEWRSVIARFGITEDEVADDPAKIDFVRLRPGSLKVPVERSHLLFRANGDGQAGDFVAAVPVEGELETKGYRGAELKTTTTEHKETLVFSIGAPMSAKGGKTLVFEITLQLPTAEDVTKPWRKPTNAKLEPPRTGAAAGVVRVPKDVAGGENKAKSRSK